MIRADSSHRPHTAAALAKPRFEMMMPRLTHSQMLAILRESGVPENEARSWIAHDPTIVDVSSGEG